MTARAGTTVTPAGTTVTPAGTTVTPAGTGNPVVNCADLQQQVTQLQQELVTARAQITAPTITTPGTTQPANTAAIGALTAQLTEANANRTALQASLDAATANVTQLTADLTQARTSVTDLGRQLIESEATLQASTERVAELQTQVNEANERIAELRAALQNTEAAAQARVEGLTQQRTAAESAAVRLNEELKAAQADLITAQARSQAAQATAQAEIARLTTEKAAADARVTQLAQDLTAAQAALAASEASAQSAAQGAQATAQADIARLTQEKVTVEASAAKLSQDLVAAQTANQTAEAENSALKKQSTEAIARVTNLEQQVNTANTEVQRLTATVGELTSRIEELNTQLKTAGQVSQTSATEVTALRVKLEGAQKEIIALKAKLPKTPPIDPLVLGKLAADLDTARAALIASEAEIAKRVSAGEKLASDVEAARTESGAMTVELKKARDGKQKAEEELAEARAKGAKNKAANTKTIEGLRFTVQAANDAVDDLEAQINAANERIASLEQQQAVVAKEKATLEAQKAAAKAKVNELNTALEQSKQSGVTITGESTQLQARVKELEGLLKQCNDDKTASLAIAAKTLTDSMAAARQEVGNSKNANARRVAQEHETMLNTLRKGIDEMREQQDFLKSQNVDLIKQIEQAQLQYAEMELRKSECDRELLGIKQKCSNILQSRDLEIIELKSQIANLASQIKATELTNKQALNAAGKNKNATATELNKLNATLQASLEAANNAHAAEKASLEARVQGLETNLAAKTEESSHFEADLHAAQEANAQISTDVSTILGDLDLGVSETDSVTQKVQALKNAYNDLLSQLANATGHATEASARVTELESERATRMSELDALRDEVDRKNTELEALKASSAANIAKTKANASTKEATAISQLQAQLETVKAAQKASEEAARKATEDLAAAQGELTTVRARVEELQAQLTALNGILPSNSENTADLGPRIKKLQKDLADANSRYESLLEQQGAQVAELAHAFSSYPLAKFNSSKDNLPALIERVRNLVLSHVQMVTEAKATELKLKELETRCAKNVAELTAKSAELATAQTALEAERNASSNLTTELNAIRAKTAQNIENAKRTATTAQQKVIAEAQAQLHAAEAATTEARRQCDQTTIQHMSQITNLTGQLSSLKENTRAQVQEIQALLAKANNEKQVEIAGLQQKIKECNDKLSAHSARTYTNVVSGRTGSGGSVVSGGGGGGGSSSSSSSSVTPASGTVWRVHPHQGQVSFGGGTSSGTSSHPSSPSSGNEIFAFTRPTETATAATAAPVATAAATATDSQIVPHVVRIDNRTTVPIPLIYHRIGAYGALEYFEFTKDEGLVGRSPAQATVIINKYLKEKGYGPSNRYSYMGAVPNRGKKHFRSEHNKRKNNPLRKTRKNRK